VKVVLLTVLDNRGREW